MTYKTLIAGGATALILGLGLLSGLAAPADAATVTTLDGAKTDNFKACWNSDPKVPDARSYVSLKSITVGGVAFRHSMTLPAGATLAYSPASEGIALKGSDNSSAWLTASSTSSNVASNSVRVDSNGEFGATIALRDRAALRTASVTETFTVARTKGGTVLGTATAVYQYDEVAASAPPSTPASCDTNPYSREYNGPSGRWYVAGVATYFDWDTNKAYPPKASSSTDRTAPILQSVAVPATTTARTITVGLTASDNVKVTEVRFANEDGNWGAWQPFAPSKQWQLSSSATASKGVYAQVRDAARNESNSMYKRVTCNLPCN